MPSDISLKNSTLDDMRFKQQRAHTVQQQDLEIRELTGQHGEEIVKLQESHANLRDNLKHAYDVDISKEAEQLEERLHDVRLSADARVEDEKKAGEQAVAKTHSVYQSQIDQYRKNSEAQLEALRKQLQAAADDLNLKAKKQLKREKEIVKA